MINIYYYFSNSFIQVWRYFRIIIKLKKLFNKSFITVNGNIIFFGNFNYSSGYFSLCLGNNFRNWVFFRVETQGNCFFYYLFLFYANFENLPSLGRIISIFFSIIFSLERAFLIFMALIKKPSFLSLLYSKGEFSVKTFWNLSST